MGWLDEIKQDIQEAKDNRDTVSAVPVQRIDTLVTDPTTGAPRRRIDYAGTVWYGGRPERGRTLVGSMTEITTPFWLPDSHMYEAGAVGDTQIQATAAVQWAWASSNGGRFQIFDVSAALGANPQHSGVLFVYVAVNASADLPFGVAYRVTVVCAPEAVRPPPA